MKDRRVLPNGEIEEWERGRTTPDDFIYDPETDAYYPPGEPADLSNRETFEEFCARIDKIVEEARKEGGPHLISRDELFGPKAETSVSPSPKSRNSAKRSAAGQRDLFSDLADEDDCDASSDKAE